MFIITYRRHSRLFGIHSCLESYLGNILFEIYCLNLLLILFSERRLILREIKLSPSIFAADITRLLEKIRILEQNNVQMLHIDVMDGHFVSQMAYGEEHIRMIKKCTNIPLDVHMMVMQPEYHIESIINAGADMVTVHQESTKCLYHCIQMIKRGGKKCAVALSPATNHLNIECMLGILDMVLIMTVNPGEGNQVFLTDMLEKIKSVRKILHGKNIDIEVDGSINPSTAADCYKAGANIFVSGGYIFNGDIADNIKILWDTLKLQR